MKIIGFISFIVIPLVGAWPLSDRVSMAQAPDITGFLPGNWQHSPKPEEAEGCT